MHFINNWYCELKRPATKVGDEVSLYCFPYEGGTAESFGEYAESLSYPIYFRSVHLPGRPPFNTQPFGKSIPDIVDFLWERGASTVTPNTIIYGHGVGALLAYEWCKRLCAENSPAVVLVVAAQRAPVVPLRRELLAHLSDEIFLDRMRHFPEAPPAVFSDQKFRANFLPRFRADLALDETYNFENVPPLPIPIVAVGGIKDSSVTPNELAKWSILTSEKFTIRLFCDNYIFSITTFSEIIRLAHNQLKSFY
jgi:medium-chain acyl-[acyl-carrier-protein] hydrolase